MQRRVVTKTQLRNERKADPSFPEKSSGLGLCVKNLEATLYLVEFSKSFDSKHREKLEQILLVYILDYVLWASIYLMKENGLPLEAYDVL